MIRDIGRNGANFSHWPGQRLTVVAECRKGRQSHCRPVRHVKLLSHCLRRGAAEAGANIFETTAKVYFVQLGTQPDWVFAQPDNAGFSDSQKQ